VDQASTILIVDDEPIGRETMEALLFGQGYDLAFAKDGLQALAQAKDLTPDLILLDVMMPGMDGYEVCQRLRADPHLAEVPVIMVTALDDRDSRLRGIEAGADDFVTKPFDRAELRARVRTVTRLNRYRRLLAERSRFEWVVEHASEGYLVLGEGDVIVYTNPQARLYLGLPPRSSGQQGPAGGSVPDATTFLELVRKQYRCEPHEGWTRWTTRSGVDNISPLYLVRPESETANAFWLQVEALALPAEPGRRQVVRLRDVTAELTRQRDMRGFHETIRHKMRTPLMSMITGLELLVRHASKLSPEDVIELSTAALNGTRRLHSTIEDILAYLDVSGSTKPGPRFEISRLPSLAADIGSVLGIEPVRLTCPQALRTARVALSAQAVELALWEILENAHKFHPRRAPTVEIAVAYVRPGQISLQIQDDGMTISPEHLSQIWTPYYQGEKYFTGETPGMGLGLPSVAALVWEVGGTCRVYNREDATGIVVELLLPLEENGEQALGRG
jgi:CheY-like chemotaxis protein/anti-sigma regulatory factor (Ser/Thr protein kinase)